MPTPDELIGILLSHYGPQGWWPLFGESLEKQVWLCHYRLGDYHFPLPQAQRFEVGAGAILTQHTNWQGAHKALYNLKNAGLLDAQRMAFADENELVERIRCSGHFNQKQARLKIWAQFFMQLQGRAPTRSELLALHGLGPETADSILLYAYGQAVFIADAYARRIMQRIAGRFWTYDNLQEAFHLACQAMTPAQRLLVFIEGHALLVEHGKRICQKVPRCENCLLCIYCQQAEKSATATMKCKDF